MEKEKKDNKSLIIGILIGIIIMLILIIIAIFIPKFITNNKESNNKSEIENKTEEKFVLDENDVKNWLENNGTIGLYYILEENDFDSSTYTKEKYGSFLGMSLMFGGLTNNAIESISLGYDGAYNYQYSYPIDFVKNILKPLGVGLEMIDINQMNDNFKGFANFSMDSNKFTIKVIATGLDNFIESELNRIYLNDNNEIIVNYNLKDCMEFGGECIPHGHRELVLKKTSDGYNLLKAYKVD